MHDSAPYHFASETLGSQNTKVSPCHWPGFSPGLNPIMNV